MTDDNDQDRTADPAGRWWQREAPDTDMARVDRLVEQAKAATARGDDAAPLLSRLQDYVTQLAATGAVPPNVIQEMLGKINNRKAEEALANDQERRQEEETAAAHEAEEKKDATEDADERAAAVREAQDIMDAAVESAGGHALRKCGIGHSDKERRALIEAAKKELVKEGVANPSDEMAQKKIMQDRGISEEKIAETLEGGKKFVHVREILAAEKRQMIAGLEKNGSHAAAVAAAEKTIAADAAKTEALAASALEKTDSKAKGRKIRAARESLAEKDIAHPSPELLARTVLKAEGKAPSEIETTIQKLQKGKSAVAREAAPEQAHPATAAAIKPAAPQPGS